MANKITKGLSIPADLAAEFDREVERLARLMPEKLDAEHVGAAALLTFLRLPGDKEKLEAGHVGAAAVLTFLRLPGDKEKLEAIRDAKNYALDQALKRLPRDGLATAEDADRVVDDASSPTGGLPAGTETRRKKQAEG